RVVYAAACGFNDGQEREVKGRVPRGCKQGGESAAFALREGKLFAFHDLRTPGGPFAGVIDIRSVEALRYEDLWATAEGAGRYMTADGEKLLPPDQVGRRVTRMKARMFNDLYLREVNLWRDFLSDSSARFTIKVGGSPGVVVETELLAFQAEWPGVQDDVKS